MRESTYLKLQIASIVLAFIAMGMAVSVLVLNGCYQDVKPKLQFTEITEDGWQPDWTPQALCDSVTGIDLHAPIATFAGVTDGYIYSNGEIIDGSSWIEDLNPYATLASIIGGEWCEETLESMGMLTIAGYVDVDVVPDQNYYIIVEVSGHPQPYGLLVGE